MTDRTALAGSYLEVREACDSLLATWVSAIDASLAPAMSGDRLAARRYAMTCLALVDFVSESLPTAPSERRWLARVARREAVTLPFRSPLVENHAGLSVVLSFVADMRQMAPGLAPLDWSEESTARVSSILSMDEAGVREFERVVDSVIDASSDPLEEIIDSFDLSNTDVGTLFGVTRQAISHWLDGGVPADRQAKLATVAQIATLLRRHLLIGRIPGIVRKPADAYDGRSLLEMIADGHHLEALEITRRSFDWASTA